MLQPRGTTGALQRICPRCGPYGRWANQDDRMGSRCHDESEVRALRLSAVLGKERKSPGLTDSSQRCSATPITWSPCSNPSAIGLFNSKLPPGPPKKVAEHGPTTRDRGCYLLSLAPGVISRPAMVSPLTDAARAKKLSRLMHGWLSEDLQLSLPKLESTKGRIYTFAAFLGAP